MHTESKPINQQMNSSNTGTFIAIAWPETLVAQEGKWYDSPMKWLRLNKEGYYKAGHAAFVLVDHEQQTFAYYDFGRYHTPAKHGRVRSAVTDPELTIRTKPIIRNGYVVNIETMLYELQSNSACHGDGKLMASNLNAIDVAVAKEYISKQQSHSCIPYGPLKVKGTNCSRFVCQTARRAAKNPLLKLLLAIPYTISPSPMFNLRVINSTSRIHVVRGRETKEIEPFIPNWIKQ